METELRRRNIGIATGNSEHLEEIISPTSITSASSESADSVPYDQTACTTSTTVTKQSSLSVNNEVMPADSVNCLEESCEISDPGNTDPCEDCESLTLNGNTQVKENNKSLGKVADVLTVDSVSQKGSLASELNEDGDIISEMNFEEDPVLYEKKKKEIEDVLSTGRADIEVLKQLSIGEGGLACDKMRQQIWPELLGINPEAVTPAPSQKEIMAHQDYQQVVLDVNRSLKRFPPGIPAEQRVVLQDQLTRLILRVIMKHPHLSYYQGYHDVAVTFLLVVGEDVAFQIMETLSNRHLKEFMEPTMDRTTYLLNYVYPLIGRVNPDLYDFMEKAGVGTMFCLPWLITWYGHVLNHYRQVVRLYDYFLASPPLTPLYLAAAIVIYRQDEVLASDCDMACLHSLLSRVPDDLPFESLLKETTRLYTEYPPESVESEVEALSRRNMLLRKQEEQALRRRQLERRGRGALRRVFVPMLVDRFVPHWGLPYGRRYIRFIIATATIAVGFYAYLRTAEAVEIKAVTWR